MAKTKTFQYKDSNRYYWTLKITAGAALEEGCLSWIYELSREDDGIKFCGDFEGSEYLSPRIDEIMGKILSDVGYLSIGFSKYGKDYMGKYDPEKEVVV